VSLYLPLCTPVTSRVVSLSCHTRHRRDWVKVGDHNVTLIDLPINTTAAVNGYAPLAAVDWQYSTAEEDSGRLTTPESPAASIPLSPRSAPQREPSDLLPAELADHLAHVSSCMRTCPMPRSCPGV
jgi:hypothetical protein